ncbi:hypothetical protein BKA70DRAFT_1444685 [Coprinopsis sp. MPI-PUGE-AT-0042]|nr:hypothetical protein BKA70DRAFT_1444685 [Coprinopsis sp. MPI-PUGE-AT-0042]
MPLQSSTSSFPPAVVLTRLVKSLIRGYCHEPTSERQNKNLQTTSTWSPVGFVHHKARVNRHSSRGLENNHNWGWTSALKSNRNRFGVAIKAVASGRPLRCAATPGLWETHGDRWDIRVLIRESLSLDESLNSRAVAYSSCSLCILLCVHVRRSYRLRNSLYGQILWLAADAVLKKIRDIKQIEERISR